MAYSMKEKAVLEYRLKLIKAGFKKLEIKYYASAAKSMGLVKGASEIKRLHNVMSGGVKDERALVILEKVAGIDTSALQLA